MQPKRRKMALAPSPKPVTSPKKRVTNHVYFLGCRGFIKIGTAACAKSRHRAVQTVSPFEVRLLCAVPGNAELERSLHSKFWHLRERGEWFRESSDLNDYIAKSLERTRAANLKAWLAVAVCERCRRETRCDVRRQDVEVAVVPLQFTQNINCIRCMLDDAHQYRPQPHGILPSYPPTEQGNRC
jgi:hypothetical protein